MLFQEEYKNDLRDGHCRLKPGDFLLLCKVTDDLYIGAFVMFGDVELTVHCAAELLKRAPEYDYIIAPEAKAIPPAVRNGAA